MKMGFYPKLAFEGIRKNKRMYVPYILTCVGMVCMLYIIMFLSDTGAISGIIGEGTIRPVLKLGGCVIAFFACIFLFYTNSFLMRRRKKEFGLYNILGMGKRHIALMLFWETAMTALFSLVAGLFCGISLSKLAELLLLNIVQQEVSYTFSVSVTAITFTAVVFGVIFTLLLLNGIRQVRFSSAITLLKSENTGEKPPKSNVLVGLLGIALLAGAYFIALTIKDPLSTLTAFFIAVLMVIAGTYLLMTASSVLLCRILQKNKSYYYKPNHFVSISSMVYRMKRNGAGLASICILATMVLVMISSTASLYFGCEGALLSRYPREINNDFFIDPEVGAEALSDENINEMKSETDALAEKYGITPKNAYAYRSAYIAGIIRDGIVETDASNADIGDALTGVWQFYFVPLSDYNKIMGTDETLEKGEALIYTYRAGYDLDRIAFKNGQSFKIKKQADSFVNSTSAAMSAVSTMLIVVPDLSESIKGLADYTDHNGDPMLNLRYRWIYYFDTGAEDEKNSEFANELYYKFNSDESLSKYGLSYCNYELRSPNRKDFYALYGGLMYLGIILSAVFIFAAVLIIYYKQISEGYEDKARFEIMKKVGMTEREIRKNINSQLLTVFFLPPGLAACHLFFAFPMIEKMLLLMNLNDSSLFAAATIICIIVFLAFYMLVYRITSSAYFNIVNGGKEE